MKNLNLSFWIPWIGFMMLGAFAAYAGLQAGY